ncbi:hypothetical protein DK317_15855, partial [Listeria monocytogenes]
RLPALRALHTVKALPAIAVAKDLNPDHLPAVAHLVGTFDVPARHAAGGGVGVFRFFGTGPAEGVLIHGVAGAASGAEE